MINKTIKSVKTTILTLLLTAVLASATDNIHFYPSDYSIALCNEILPPADNTDGVN